MAEKWHRNGSLDADDREKEICYTDTVYKWVLRCPLVFIFRKGDQFYEVLSILWGGVSESAGFILPGMREDTCRGNSAFGAGAACAEEKAEHHSQGKEKPEKKNGAVSSSGTGSGRSFPEG